MKFTAALCLFLGLANQASAQTWLDAANATGMFSTLAGAIDATNLTTVIEGLGNTTAFGPLDSAFEGVNLTGVDVASVLKYHVVLDNYPAASVLSLLEATPCIEVSTLLEGSLIKVHLDDGVLKINDAIVNLNYTDIMGSNGILHGIESILLPQTFNPCIGTSAPSAAPGPGATNAPTMMTNVTDSFIDTALATGEFGALLKIVQDLGVDALLAPAGGDLTVFGPIDAAMAALPADITNEVVVATLTEHVVPGRYTAADVAAALEDKGCIEIASWSTATDPAKKFIKIEQHGNMIMLNDAAHLIMNLTDLNGPDGVFHGIDKVLEVGSFTPCGGMDPSPTAAPEEEDSASSFGVAGLFVASAMALAGFFS